MIGAVELYEQLMESCTKQDLIVMAKTKNIAVKTSMRKGDIARMLADKMLRPDVMGDYIKWMNFRERNFLLSLAGIEPPVDDITDMEEMMFPMNLFESGYLFFDEFDGTPFLTEDVKNLLRKVWTREMKGGCRQYEWVIQCLELAAQIYGIVPYTVLARLIRQKVQYGMAVSALPRLLREIPEDISHYSVGDKSVYDKAIEPLVSKLEFPSEGEDYYIPSVYEIENGIFLLKR